MPLITTTLPNLKAKLASAPATAFVIMSSSKNAAGERWCGPCAAMAPALAAQFSDSAAYAIVVELEQDEVTADANWTLDAWGGGGVPLIFRIVDGSPSGAIIGYSRTDFATALERYVAGEDAYEAYLRETQGERYEPFATRGPKFRAALDALLAQNRAAAKEQAEAERAQTEVGVAA